MAAQDSEVGQLPQFSFDQRNDQDFSNLKQQFEDRKVRRKFLLRANLILLVQYCFTFAVMVGFHFAGLGKWFKQHPWIPYVVLFGLLFSVMLIIICCGRVRWKSPCCYFVLIYKTLAVSGVFASISAGSSDWSMYTIIAVIGLAVIVNVVCAAIPHTKFCSPGAIGYYVFVVLTTLWLIAVFLRPGRKDISLHVLQTVVVFCFTIVIAFFMSVDMYLIVNGMHYYQITPTDYTVGATHLYIDFWTAPAYLWHHLFINSF